MNDKNNINLKQEDNEEDVPVDVSTPTNAAVQHHDETYFAWWKKQWGMLDIL